MAAYRAERAERHILKAKYLADKAAPADLDVLSAIDEVERLLASAHHEALAAAGLPQRCTRCDQKPDDHDQPGARCVGFRLQRVAAGDPSWGSLMASSELVAPAIERSLVKARAAAERALELTDAGQLLMAPCPSCQGKTEAMPAGSLTLRAFTPGAAPDMYVLCVNPACDPDPEMCGYRKGGRPMWAFHELGWLAEILGGGQEDALSA